MKKLLIALLALLTLASCAEKKPSIPLYGWDSIGKNPNLEEVRDRFQNYKAHGFTGICVQADLADLPAISAIAHEEGLEYHAWKPCMLQGDKPHDWYCVNRLGQSADEFPAYVQYYKALDPANPEVQDYIVSMLTEIAAVPDVDYVQLDYIRYADAILARGLWDKYVLQRPVPGRRLLLLRPLRERVQGAHRHRHSPGGGPAGRARMDGVPLREGHRAGVEGV